MESGCGIRSKVGWAHWIRIRMANALSSRLVSLFNTSDLCSREPRDFMPFRLLNFIVILLFIVALESNIFIKHARNHDAVRIVPLGIELETSISDYHIL